MELWVLRLVHIPTSILWAGWAVMVGLFLLPAIAEAGPAGGAVMGGIMKRRFSLWMNVLGLLAVVSGLRLYMMSMSGAWLATGTGVAYSLGAAAALVAFSVGHAVSRPTAGRMNALLEQVKAAGGPPSAEQAAELGRLRGRAATAGTVNAWCALVAAVCMGAGRYFPG